MIRQPSRVFAIFMAAIVFAACSHVEPSPSIKDSQADAPAIFEVVQHRDEFELGSEIHRVVIINRHGDVRIRTIKEPILGLIVNEQRIGATPLNAEFEVTRKDGALTLTVHYVNDAAWPEGDHSRGRADMVVWLPKETSIDVLASDGTVQIKGWAGPVRVRTGAGQIRASGRGDIDVESVSGNIMARQTSGSWSGLARIVSQSGNILAAIPVSADVELSAKAGAILSVDPGLPAPVDDAGGGMRLDAHFGSARRRMEIHSNANVHLVPVIK